MNCYDNIIGLTRRQCNCCHGENPDGPTESGLYLDELTPLDRIEATGSECDGAVWDMMATARDEAVREFIAHTNSVLMTRYRPRRAAYAGTLGRKVGHNSVNPGTQYYGVRFRMRPIRNAVLRLYEIGGLFSAAGTATVMVYTNANEKVAEYTLTTGNGHVSKQVFLELPLVSDYMDVAEYFFVMAYNPANPTKNNTANCSPCEKFTPRFCCDRPMWNDGGLVGSRAWANWFMVGNWTGNDLGSFDSCSMQTGTDMHGLTFRFSVDCDYSKILCPAFGGFDFQSNPVALAIAFAIRYKAAEILGEKILRSGAMNRLTMLNAEALAAAVRDWRTKYNEHTAYIAGNVSVTDNDCVMCEPVGRVQTILT